MITLGIDLEKYNTIEMFKKLEHEIDEQESLLMGHAIACYQRDLKGDYIYYSSSCRFESAEVHQQLLKDLSDMLLYLKKYCEEKCEEID